MEGLGRRGRAADEADGAAQETFPRRLRIRRRRDFLRVQRSGTKLHTRFFLVFVAPSALREPGGAGPASDPSSREQLPGTRLGVTVTRKVGKAVKRNRIKRLVREAFRRERHALPAGLDMVWVAKRDAAAATYADVVQDVRTLAGRLRQSGPLGAAGRSSRRRAGSAAAPSPSRSR